MINPRNSAVWSTDCPTTSPCRSGTVTFLIPFKTRTGPEMGVATNDVGVVTAKDSLAWRRSRHDRLSEQP